MGKKVSKNIENKASNVMQWYKVPEKIYFKRGALDLALRELKGRKKAFIISDRFLFSSGATQAITRILDDIKIGHEIFFDIKPDLTLTTLKEAYSIMKPYSPDVVIGFGGGSAMDAAKLLWLKNQQSDFDFNDISMCFTDINKNVRNIDKVSKKSVLVCITTTSGTGSEITPFSILTDEKTNIKYTVADYALTPYMAIIDPDFVDSMPKELASSCGLDALSRAIEAYTSPMATNFTNSNALEAIKLIFRYLSRSYHQGKDDPVAREKMHYASTIAAMAFANSYTGICHSMALKLSSLYNISHGVSDALLIRQIIKYNAKKSDYNTLRYSQIADELHLDEKTNELKMNRFVELVDELITELELPKSLKELGISEKEFNSNLEKLSELVLEDYCSISNVQYPTKDEIKQIYKQVFTGKF